MALFVIVHGGWSGGWYFQSTARLMRAAGHEVYTPTLTGIGERVHLAHADVDLSLHIQDVVNVLEFEEMHEVVLVGYSYGGMVVTGVADRIPQRISQIIYLDAFVPENGQSVADLDAMRNEGKETDIPIIDGWRVPHYPPQPRKTDHPIKTFTQAIRLTNPAESLQLPRTYV
ncbi:MAG TPA: alpha/beta fold hydrolase, partial [Caldilineaceae bacterium]|nr:alpha/beta fold hydrolase [Caldilineaceae bacterium]